jgi:hypothetical protein
MKRITLTFGLISGTVIIVYTFVVLLVFGDFSTMSLRQFRMVEALGYLRYLILLLTIFFAMRTFCKQAGQPVNYLTIVKQGIMVTILVAILIGIMEYFYMVVTPDFYENYSQLYIKQMKHNGATTEMMNQAKHEMGNYKWMQNPLMTGLFYFFETFLIGAVATLLIGIFLKSKKTGQALTN